MKAGLVSPAWLPDPGRDLAAFFFAAIGSLMWVTAFRELTKMGVIDSKLSRKLVHVSSGTLFVASWVLFSEAWYARYVAACVPLLNGIRFLLLGLGVVKDTASVNSISREGSPKELLGGPLYYVGCMLAGTLLFWRESPVGICSLAMMCGGDGFADIFGRRFGKHHKLPFNPDKSWAGSLAMFLSGGAIALFFVFFYTKFGFLSESSFGTSLQSVFLIAFVGTLVEALPISDKIDDNLSVSLMTMLTGLVCMKYF
eukprot:CAMPEP_0196581282 /NCGR_PEP_ID=MMETSP1081-20130531/33360_1 /TAXON_ID=36882 /ORGANISM="Pyramimonas amylifera, Strain CCMP720" /LENGTH=254 /DNA_ID=CAMNT_0041901457 /DNA_START=438 /DNA_END=1202 /DNA_ORIENTATION=+